MNSFFEVLRKLVVFRSSNELKLAKAFSSVTSDDKKKSYTKSFPKSVTNSSFPFTTKLPIDINPGKSSTTENTAAELCQKCRRAVDRYSKCSGMFNFWTFSPHIPRLLQGWALYFNSQLGKGWWFFYLCLVKKAAPTSVLLDQEDCPWIPALNEALGLIMIKPSKSLVRYIISNALRVYLALVPYQRNWSLKLYNWSLSQINCHVNYLPKSY